jgi:transcriptional regulator with XRE-family HTH domain
MTARSNESRSLYDERASTLVGALGLAAATLAMRVTRMLLAAKSESKLSHREIAERLGVTEGRVSQVLNGDGNVHVATFARFMRALGYTVEIVASPVEPGRGPLNLGSRRRKRSGRDDNAESRNFDVYEQVFLTGEGPMKVPMFVPSDDVLGCAPQGAPKYAGTVNVTKTRNTATVRRMPARVEAWRASHVDPHAAARHQEV